jgi:biofilm PGA synthesis protein PgaA
MLLSLKVRRFLRTSLTGSLLGCLLLAVGQPFAMTTADDDYQALIARARSGEHAEVLPVLRERRKHDPYSKTLLADTFVVLHWAGRDPEALALLPAIANCFAHSIAPAYLLTFVIKSGRRLAQSLTALQAQAFLNQQRTLQPESFSLTLELERLLMLRDSGEWLAALTHTEWLLLRHPQASELLAFKAETAAQAGSYSIALDVVGQFPSVIPAASAIKIRQDWNSQWVRVGAAMQSASDSPDRFAVSDAAVANGYQWLDNSEAKTSAFDRSRFDQIAALRDRDAMLEAIELYQSLDGEVPGYVLIAVAEAHLRTRQPAKAARLYERALAGSKSPDTWEQRIAYAYALLDSEQALAALEVIEEIDIEISEAASPHAPTRHDQNIRHWRERIEVIRANFERFTQRYDLAALRLELARIRSPFDADVRLAQAGLLANRELPRQSLALIDRVAIDYPDSAPARLARADALLELGEIGQARAAISDSLDRLGEHPRLEQLNQKMRRKTAPWLKLSFDASVGEENAAFITPPRERKMEAYAESHLIDDRFRILASANYHRAYFPEGQVLRRYQGLGLSWDNPQWSIVGMGLAGSGDAPGGYRLRARHRFSDSWSVLARAANNSEEAPLRATAAGISLNTRGIQLEWRKFEHRSVAASYDSGHYSDQNRRQIVAMNWRERWHSEPHHSLSSNLSLSSARHSLADLPYFSPSQYTSVALAIIAQQVIARLPDRAWKHQLTVEPAVQMQAGTGRRFGGSIRYEQEMDLTRDIGVRAGLNYLRRTFDGAQEQRWIASVDWFMRF